MYYIMGEDYNKYFILNISTNNRFTTYTNGQILFYSTSTDPYIFQKELSKEWITLCGEKI